MRRSNRLLRFIPSLFLALLLISCASQIKEERSARTGGIIEKDDLVTRMERLGQTGQLSVLGNITIRTPSDKREGRYELNISGDTMKMEIFAKGIKAGEILFDGNNASVSPSLNDEYMEYMFAVIIRDAVAWWNICDYEHLEYEDVDVLRNSWRKLYLKPGVFTPIRQIFKLMKFRTVEVLYTKEDSFNGEVLPAALRFNYMSYGCEMSIDTMRF